MKFKLIFNKMKRFNASVKISIKQDSSYVAQP